MAAIMLVTPQHGAAAEILPALALLPHEVRVVPTTLAALDAVAAPDTRIDVIVIDGRGDLAAARRLSTLLAAHPVLLVVPAGALSFVQADWGMADFILAEHTPEELAARLRMLTGPAPAGDPGSPIHVDEDGYQATLDGRLLDLTYTEFELLKFLAANPGRVHSREVLLSEVWGYDYYGGTRTVDVHVRRLRAKFGNEHESLIETVRNVGYRFNPRG